jgi:hypothetical protein
MLITIIHGGYLRYIRHFEIPPHHAGLYQLVNLIRGIMHHVSPPGEKNITCNTKFYTRNAACIYLTRLAARAFAQLN